jgi:predicted GH43/DUF377 family glycosyl hydrolase
VTWNQPRPVFPTPPPASTLDGLRAFGPSVLQDPDGALRMWYCGHDGSTARILEAVQHPGLAWQYVGLSIDAGMWGDTDAYGVESPSVVATPGGYLMAYSGSDGADSRLHMAGSRDGHDWDALGTFMQRGEGDSIGATHPCLLMTRRGWWLYYSGYDGSRDGRRASIHGAVSKSGASWDRIGAIFEPDEAEVAVTEPSVLAAQRRLFMFYVSDDDLRLSIEIATSTDGVDWYRQGNTLTPGEDGGRSPSVRSPCAVRLSDGTLRLWYAAHGAGDADEAYRLWSTDYLIDSTN